MSRTPEVERAVSNTKAGIYCTDDADALAAEVERLEAELAKSDEAARAAMYALDERAFLAECAEKSEKRAEAAEARVKELKLKLMRQDEAAREAYEAAVWKYGQERMELEARVAELEAEALNGRHAVFTDLKAQLAAANEQNARLRAALEGVSLLAHCISKAGPLNTPDLETAWRKFDLISVKAAEALVDRKAVLNDEEASK